jgi:hypothetical protein
MRCRLTLSEETSQSLLAVPTTARAFTQGPASPDTPMQHVSTYAFEAFEDPRCSCLVKLSNSHGLPVNGIRPAHIIHYMTVATTAPATACVS